MVTSLNIDPALLQAAIDLNSGDTIDRIVDIALREYIQRRQQLKVMELFGTIDYGNYDYKQQRQHLHLHRCIGE